MAKYYDKNIFEMYVLCIIPIHNMNTYTRVACVTAGSHYPDGHKYSYILC